MNITRLKSVRAGLDVEIAIELKEANKAFKVEKYVPAIRTAGAPIDRFCTIRWTLSIHRATASRDANDQAAGIQWKPRSTGEGHSNWLQNLNDWNLSRSRYWGIPLPVWSTESGSERKLIGSVEELKRECAKAVAAGLMDEDPLAGFVPGDMSEANYDQVDLHRPHMDEIVLLSSDGQPMHRESDLIDVWFDSGSMPYAQWHYPFENKEKFKTLFPADFIAEGVDQTRGWFYTLHAIASMVFDSPAYKTVVSNGLVLDKNGQKMSKRLGNAVDPFETMDRFGADATRWYMVSNAQPWDNLRFDSEGIAEVQRKFFGTLYNTYNFFALYANIEGFTPDKKELHSVSNPLDFGSSRVEQSCRPGGYFLRRVRAHACRPGNTGIHRRKSEQLVRAFEPERFWKSEQGRSTWPSPLHHCLETVALLMAPIAPSLPTTCSAICKTDEVRTLLSVH